MGKKDALSIRIPEETNKKLTSYVEQLGITKNALVLNLIHQEIRKFEKQQQNKVTK